MAEDRALLAIAEALAERLRGYKLLALQALDQGRSHLVLATEDLWSPQSEATLTALEARPESETDLQRIAAVMAHRLGTWRRMQAQALEAGREEEILHPGEVWECGDQAALAAFEDYRAKITGAQPLFEEATV